MKTFILKMTDIDAWNVEQAFIDVLVDGHSNFYVYLIMFHSKWPLSGHSGLNKFLEKKKTICRLSHIISAGVVMILLQL